MGIGSEMLLFRLGEGICPLDVDDCLLGAVYPALLVSIFAIRCRVLSWLRNILKFGIFAALTRNNIVSDPSMISRYSWCRKPPLTCPNPYSCHGSFSSLRPVSCIQSRRRRNSYRGRPSLQHRIGPIEHLVACCLTLRSRARVSLTFLA